MSTSIKTGGSGYADGTYPNVALDWWYWFRTSCKHYCFWWCCHCLHQLLVLLHCKTTELVTFLSAADADLGSGGGSGFELEVTGNGDGMIVVVAAGVYQEIAPIQIKRRNVSIIGQALRSCIVHPNCCYRN